MHGRGFGGGYYHGGGGYGGYGGYAMESMPMVPEIPYMAQAMYEQVQHAVHYGRHHYPSTAGAYLPEISVGGYQPNQYEQPWNGGYHQPHYRHHHMQPGSYGYGYNPSQNFNYNYGSGANQYGYENAPYNYNYNYNNYQQNSNPSYGYGNDYSYASNGYPSNQRTYDGAHVNSANLSQNVRIVAQIARSKGVDPAIAVACMLVESGGDNTACGDHGNSFGLFQLNRHGELGNLSPQQAFNPYVNANVALSHFQSSNQYCANPGLMAAYAQNPADKIGYANKVNAKLAQARYLISSQNC